jgi:hypothetical protein
VEAKLVEAVAEPLVYTEQIWQGSCMGVSPERGDLTHADDVRVVAVTPAAHGVQDGAETATH